MNGPARRSNVASGGASADTRFTLDGGNLAAEYDGSTGNVLRRYVFGPGDDEAQRGGSANLHRPLSGVSA